MARSFFSWNKTFILLVITIYNYIFHWFVCKFILLNEFHVCWLFCKKSYLRNFTLWVNNSRVIANRVYNMSPSSIHLLKFQILDIYNINLILELLNFTLELKNFQEDPLVYMQPLLFLCVIWTIFFFSPETMECQGSNCPSPGGAGAGTQIQASVFTVLLFGLASLLVLWMQYRWKRKTVSMQEQGFYPQELLNILCSSWIFF